MTILYSPIGLPASSDAELLKLAKKAAENSTEIAREGGRYLCWSDPESGVELWLQLDEVGELLRIHPHYAGAAEMPVKLTARVERGGDSPQEGGFYAWADPGETHEDAGAYPFVFDCPDFGAHAALSLPHVTRARIAAFTIEAQVYGSADDYYAAQQGEPKRDMRSFLPTGLFEPDGVPKPAKEALAAFSGVVSEAAEKTNPLTGTTFWWAHVDTHGGAYDVVMTLHQAADAPPRKGAILAGSFWLTGRLTG